MKADLKSPWFETWFDSPYYHQLYKNRDQSEAESFIDELIRFLQPQSTDRFLDLACGKGRHTQHLANKGFPATGVDLSVQSIESAKQAYPQAEFFVHDMRQLFRTNYYDFILNLFTSFGYFENTRDNLKVLQSCYKQLKPNGTLVIDFLNPQRVIDNLVPHEFKEVDDLKFEITRQVKDQKVIKTIQFSTEGKDFAFQEKVQLFYPKDFQEMIGKTNFALSETFGDYRLSEFDQKNSPRQILVLRK